MKHPRSNQSNRQTSSILALVAGGMFLLHSAVAAQEIGPNTTTPTQPQKIEVTSVAHDEAIAARLEQILEATGWFESPQVRVKEGIVFLSGRARTERDQTWAEQVAASTEDVVAVVNQIDVIERSIWDMSAIVAEFRSLAHDAVRHTPLILVAVFLLVASWFAAKFSVRGATVMFHGRVRNDLLREVAARAVAVPVFLLGLYLVLKMSGLTRLAVTVLGGTGLLGLVIGFAFRDIAENFLASLLLSMQRPFNTGDLIEVAGKKGYVQQLTTRCTLLMTLEGNHVQIPNSTIFKETITNHFANPQMRCDFKVGIGYSDAIGHAQSVGLAVMQKHPAVLDDPEPMVLAESLGAATVNLRFFFWINVHQHSAPKMLSAIIRLTKRAFQNEGISMPDEQREVVFPEGVPLRRLPRDAAATPEKPRPSPPAEDAASSHLAEGGLESEAEEIEEQARHARLPEGGRNLLAEDPGPRRAPP